MMLLDSFLQKKIKKSESIMIKTGLHTSVETQFISCDQKIKKKANIK